MSREVYVGLDLETSGTDIDAGAVPIQIGVALGAGAELQKTELIGWTFEPPEVNSWQASSEEVHGIPVETVQRAYRDGSTPVVVDRRVAEFLTTFAHVGPHEAVLVGWNVGSFDFPFVRRYLPQTAALCSYRFTDLNSVCFTLARAGRQRVRAPEQALSVKTLKRRAKQAAAEMIGGESRWHDAGYDALASLLAWYWLCEKFEARP